MKVAIYIRVSRIDLKLENQKIQLEEYAKKQNWEYEIFEEKESTRKTRPIKKEVLHRACRGEFDIILIWKLDRWARNLNELLYDIWMFKKHKVEFRCLHECLILDPNNPNEATNMLMWQILGAFSEFERAVIRDRTMTGLERARKQGKKLGRPRKQKVT